MATDYKIVVVPDTGGTRPCMECLQCLGLQLLCVIQSVSGNTHTYTHIACMVNLAVQVCAHNSFSLSC